MISFRVARPGTIININGLADLDYIRSEDGILAIAALRASRGRNDVGSGQGRLPVDPPGL
jgi:hypothetical protein